MTDDDIQPQHRPVLRESQRETIRGVVARRHDLRRQIAAAQRAHLIYVSGLRAQLRGLPSFKELAHQFGVSEGAVSLIGRGHQYKHKNLLDEREQARASA